MTPLRLGSLDVPNRVFMAPLTRSRAGEDGIPSAVMATYYAQRASAGLIISEATNISAVARGFGDTPGLFTDAQVAGWRGVTEAVHGEGGRIFAQLWHTGRVSHELLHPGQPCVSASAVPSEKTMAFVFTEGVGQRVAASPPVALDSDGIANTIADYVGAARNAIEAGFDGVEVHGANGYLLHQFLASNVNQRTDEYGGSASNRARMLVEVTTAVAAAIGADRVGVRVSPVFRGNGIDDANPTETFHVVGAALDPLGLAYLHLADTAVMAPGVNESMSQVLAAVGGTFTGPIVLNGAYDAARARADIDAGRADAIAFGRAFISNPDLPARLAQNAPLKDPDPRTFYGGGEVGYIDYRGLAEPE